MKDVKIRQILELLFAIGITVLVLRTFAVDSFVVKGDSMSPTVLSGDWVFVDKISYRFRDPGREDIIVVKPRTQSSRIIKRIIGLPGERIEIADSKVQIKNDRQDAGKILQEAYLNLPASTNVSLGGPATPTIGINSINLDPKEYFVLGDNRYASIDSRELGPIDAWSIGGRVFLIFRPSSLSLKIFK